MRLAAPRDFLFLGMSSGLAILLALFVKSGFWAGVVAIPSALAGCAFALRYFNLSTVLFMAGTPTLFIYANNFLEVVPYIRVERAMIVVLISALLLRVTLQKKTLKPINGIEKWMLLLLLVCGASVVIVSYGEPKEVVKNNLVTYIQGVLLPYGAYFIARQQNWSAGQINRWLLIMLLAGAYLVAAGVLQIFLDMSFFYPRYLAPPAVSDRASGTFVNPSHYGMVIAVFMFLSMLVYLRSHDRMIKVASVASMALLGIGLLLCKTRAPWMGAFLGMLFIFVFEHRSRPLIATGFVLSVLGLLVALPWLLDSGLLQERVFFIESLFPRLTSYTTAINIFIHNPFFGIGFGPTIFIEAKPEYATTFGLISMQWTRFAGVPHNEFLHILVLTGLVGFIPFLLILAWFNRLTCKRAYDGGEMEKLRNDFAFITRVVFFTYLLNCLLVDVLFFGYFLMLMFFMLGIVVSLDDQFRLKASAGARAG